MLVQFAIELDAIDEDTTRQTDVRSEVRNVWTSAFRAAKFIFVAQSDPRSAQYS